MNSKNSTSEGWGPRGPHARHVVVFPAFPDFPSVYVRGVATHTTYIHTEKCVELEQVQRRRS